MDLEGNITLQSDENAKALNNSVQKTLDEPISETILRDLRMIAYKLKYVLKPQMREENAKELRKWDLWGPLILCLLLCLVLSFNSLDRSESIFAMVFIIVWVGVFCFIQAFVVTINAKLLKADVSIFWSISVLGYCLFPLNLASIILCISLPFVLKLFVVVPAFFWSSISSIAFMSSVIEERKKILAVYPVVLFYLYLSWFILILQ